MRRPHRARTIPTIRSVPLLAAALALLALGCDPQKAVLGTWELATIDGVGPAASTPLRVIFPAVKYGSDTLALHGMWHEVVIDSLVLTLEADGAFRERAVEGKRTLARENTFERPDYVSGAFGGDLIREDAQPVTTESAGDWTMSGDTVSLTEVRARVLADLSARVQQALPDVSLGEIQEALAAAVPASDVPRWTGVARGDRLELVDSAGRRYAFRRAGSRR